MTQTPTRPRTPALAQPPADVYPSGHAGFSRAWDGAAWTGPVLVTPGAPELHARRSFWRAFAHPVFWIVFVSLVIGLGFALFGGALASVPLLVAAGLFSTGGPVVGLVLIVRHRLGIHRLPARAALVWGLVSGAVALGVAFAIETPLRPVVGLEGSYALAGPIEEGAKLLVPFVLLLFGPRIFRDPRVGIWTVALSGAVFGVGEGIEYFIDADAASTILGLSLQDSDIFRAFGMWMSRSWVEVGHIVWAAGAAAVIWLAAHRLGRAFSWLGLAAYLIAASLHSFNDAVIGLWGSVQGVAAVVWLILAYTLWFRARARQAVAPDLLAEVPRRWVPRLSKTAREAAQPPAAEVAAP